MSHNSSPPPLSSSRPSFHAPHCSHPHPLRQITRFHAHQTVYSTHARFHSTSYTVCATGGFHLTRPNFNSNSRLKPRCHAIHSVQVQVASQVRITLLSSPLARSLASSSSLLCHPIFSTQDKGLAQLVVGLGDTGELVIPKREVEVLHALRRGSLQEVVERALLR